MLITCADGSLHITLPAFHGAASAAHCNSPPIVLASFPNPFGHVSEGTASSSLPAHITMVSWLGQSSIAAAAASSSKAQALHVSHFTHPLPLIIAEEAPKEWKG
jgi:hypothetical protein